AMKLRLSSGRSSASARSRRRPSPEDGTITARLSCTTRSICADFLRLLSRAHATIPAHRAREIAGDVSTARAVYESARGAAKHNWNRIRKRIGLSEVELQISSLKGKNACSS